MGFCYINASILIKGEVNRIGGFGLCRYSADDIIERLSKQLNDSRFRAYVTGYNLNRFTDRTPLSDVLCKDPNDDFYLNNDTNVSMINIFIEDTQDDRCSVLMQKLYNALAMINDVDRLSVHEVDVVYYTSDGNNKTYENFSGSSVNTIVNTYRTTATTNKEKTDD